MVEVPANVVLDPARELATWFTVKQQLAALQATERTLRQRLFGHFFPEPKEGTNTVTLPDGYRLKGTYPIERKIDVGAYTALRAPVPDLGGQSQFEARGISADAMIKTELSLVKSAYNQLTAEQQQFFDRCLLVKPGSVSLEITPPAAKKENANA